MTYERIYLSPPDIGVVERELVADAFDSNWIAPLGPHVDAFEDELARICGVSAAAALSSGTAGLHLSLALAGVGPGDEVLCPSLTFVATANAIRYVGAIPVFIDSDPEYWTISPGLLKEVLDDRAADGRLPAAVITVDLYGQCADYGKIEAACGRFDVPLIEDAAEALGSTAYGRPAGSFGKAGVLSFNGNKIITTSGGGAIVSDDAGLIARARYLATQAREPAPHYEHTTVGYNYRLSNVLAAIGRGQLRALDVRVASRRQTFASYEAALGDLDGVEFMTEAPYGVSNRWLTTLTVDPDASGCTSEEIRLALEQNNIEARPVWKPMHLQPVYADCETVGGAVAGSLFESGLCLPSGSALTDSDLERIVAIVREVVA